MSLNYNFLHTHDVVNLSHDIVVNFSFSKNYKTSKAREAERPQLKDQGAWPDPKMEKWLLADTNGARCKQINASRHNIFTVLPN